MTLQQLREKHKHAVDRAREILKLNETLSSEQIDEVEALTAEAERAGAEIKLRQAQLDGYASPRSTSSNGVTRLTDPRSGTQTVMLSNTASVAEWIAQTSPPSESGVQPHELSMGRLILAKATGNWRGAEAEREFMLSQKTTDNAAGGYLVPQQLSGTVLDAARAQSVLFQAGCQTLPMTSDHLIVAKVITDPTFTTKAELVAWSGTDVVFGAVEFTPYTFGNVLTVSRELADDAVNGAQILEQTLARAMAVAIDNLALNGTGAAQPLGLANITAATGGFSETTSVGAIAWEDLATAVETLQLANHQPTGIILGPSSQSDLALSTTGDGSTAAKQWLAAPPNVTNLPRYVTSQCVTGDVYVGDWTKAAFAVRMQPEIVVTPYTKFAEFGLQIRIAWRGTFGLLYDAAFHRLTGITH